MNDTEEGKKREPAQSLHCAGIILAPHGIQGAVKVKTFLENPRELQDYSPLYDEHGMAEYKIEKVLSQTKDVLIVALEGIKDRTAADALRGMKLMFSREKLPEVEEDTFYHVDLIGLPVLSSRGQSVGAVHALYNFGAGDLIEIETLSHKTVMIPFSYDIVPEINIQEGKITLSDAGDLLLGEGGGSA